MLLLLAESLAAMRAQAAREYPNECLGALIRLEGSLVSAVPLHNGHPLPHSACACPPAEYLRAERLAWQLGGEICGFYHSHPDHPAVPSATDLRQAAFGEWSYVILEVRGAQVQTTRSWKLSADRKAFQEEEMIVVEGAVPCPKS